MRIVVTGYHLWSVARSVFEVMDNWLEWPYEKNTVATGACPTGADAYAKALCRSRGITLVEYPAPPEKTSLKAAKLFRNQYMIDHFRPDLVLAFMHPLCRGTRHCAEYARQQGIKVLETWEGRSGTGAVADTAGSR